MQGRQKLTFIVLMVFSIILSNKGVLAQQALVVYSSYVKDNSDIFIMDVETGIERNLTNNRFINDTEWVHIKSNE
jgi:hypothetical protein